MEQYQMYRVAFCDVWISWGICIHSFCSSLDFLVVYIELKQVITKTYIYKVVWNIV